MQSTIKDSPSKLVELLQALEVARNQVGQNARELEVLRHENARLTAAMENVRSSFGWRLVTYYRSFRDRYLPQGTRRRWAYELWLRSSRKSKDSEASPRNETRRASLPPAGLFNVEIDLLDCPSSLDAGTAGVCTVQITNASKYVWSATGSNGHWPVQVSYHWYCSDGSVALQREHRTSLSKDLAPKESSTLEMRIVAPFDPGTYDLHICPLVENVAWFDQMGGKSVRRSVNIRTPDVEMTNRVTCSLIIPVLNRASFTKACLQAIERSVSAEKVPYEVIVVDNGSTDDTPALLEHWRRTHINTRVISQSCNAGYASACNQGAQLARGKYVALVNNDTIPLPGWLEAMVHIAEQSPRVGVVGSKLLYPDDRIQHAGIMFDRDKNPHHVYRGIPDNIDVSNEEFQAVTGACMLVSRDLYWAVGGLDEAYRNSYEDIDFCFKVRQAGFTVMLCAESVLYHFEGTSEGRFDRDLGNRIIFSSRWREVVRTDADQWQNRNGCSEPEVLVPQGYSVKQEEALSRLWQRIYSSELSS